MKKILFTITILLTGLLLVACDDAKREQPTLEVPLDITVNAGVKTDISEVVEAKDQDGKDIKDTIEIEAEDESIDVEGSFITANEVGSFIIKVTVTDTKDKELKTSKNIFVDVIESDEVEEGNKTVYKFDELSKEALNGFKVLVDENEEKLSIENGELIYANGQKDAKLIKTLTFSQNETYQVKLKVKSDEEINGVSFTINSDDLEVNEIHENINNEYKELAINVTANKDLDADLVLDLGNNEGYTLYVERLFIQTSSGLEEYNVDLNKFEYYNDQGESTKEIIDDKIVIDITDPNAGIWEQKLIKTGIELEENKKYVLTYEIKANEEIKYEYIARTLSQQAGERDENYIWSAPHLNKDETRVVKHTFETNETDVYDFEMFFQFGGQKNPVEIEISNINLEYYNTFSEETTRFTGIVGFESFEGDDAKASLYVDTNIKALVYDVENFGKIDWHNKVFIENVVFEEDSRYEIKFTAKSTKTVEFFFAVNPMGQWEPKITDMIELSEEYQTFTFETDSFQTFKQNFEILFQFGEHNTGSAKIMFESIEITQLVRK